MRKSVLLTLLSFCYYIGIGIFNTALASDTPPYTITHQPTHTAELKPIPSEAFQLAKAVFLPDYLGDKFSGYKLDGDYNQKGNCDDKNSLYTTKNCSYPKAVVAASQCPFLPGYYTDCICLSKFKHTSCNSPYILGGDSCDGKYEKCVCPATVSMYYPNDYCTETCDGKCIAKSCSPDSDETDCQYGTGYTSDGCGGTRIYCKACTPSSDETGCEYGTESCSDGCGGTRTCCSAKPACTSSSSNYCSVHKTCHGDCCTDGTIKSCDTRCGGSGCNSCTPYSDETGCKYGTTSCSDGCGGTRTCCKTSTSCTPEPDATETECKYGTKTCDDGCGGTRTCCKSDPCLEGGIPEGYKICGGSGNNPTGKLECPHQTYYKDCGCSGHDISGCQAGSMRSYTQNYGSRPTCDMYVSRAKGVCYENHVAKTYTTCEGYVCADVLNNSCDPNSSLVPCASSFIGYCCQGGVATDFYRINTSS